MRQKSFTKGFNIYGFLLDDSVPTAEPEFFKANDKSLNFLLGPALTQRYIRVRAALDQFEVLLLAIKGGCVFAELYFGGYLLIQRDLCFVVDRFSRP